MTKEKRPTFSLRRLRVKNFRSVVNLDVEIPPETQVLCLVGPNGSGKSSLLSLLIDGLCQLTKEPAPDLRKGNQQPSHVREDDWRRNLTSAEIGISGSAYAIRTDWLLNEKENISFYAGAKKLGEPGSLPQLTSDLSQGIAITSSEWAVARWSSIPEQDPVSTSVFLVRPAERYEKPYYEEPKDLAVTPSVRSNWLGERFFPVRVRHFGIELERLLLDMVLGKHLNDPHAIWFCDLWADAYSRLIGQQWNEQVGAWPFRRMGPANRSTMSMLSAGELDILVTVALILLQKVAIGRKSPSYNYDENKDGPAGFVFIDELDAHLHPQWQEKILPILCALFPSIFFIVTTHSPFVLRSLPKNRTVVLRFPDGAIFKDDFAAWQVEDILKVVFEVSATWSSEITQQLKSFEALAKSKAHLSEALDLYRVLTAHDSEGLRAECRRIIALYGSAEFQDAIIGQTAKT